MSVDIARLRRTVPFVLPLVIVAVGWVVFVRQASADLARVQQQIRQLDDRLAALRAALAEPAPPVTAGDPVKAFERLVAARDGARQLLEQLARLAAEVGATNLTIDFNGTRTPVAPSGSGPRVVGASDPDPRLALFELPLAYSVVPVSFDAEYERLGEFLWRLRDLPVVVEIRTLDVRPAESLERGSRSGDTAGRPRVRASLTLYAYSRQTPQAAPMGAAP
ncbi:MAG TPA: hypothetical protein VNI78_12035 [Vicinamibacterales bacterium]|nr:hypothetical protein [Vicinamibacterales bacterium]